MYQIFFNFKTIIRYFAKTQQIMATKLIFIVLLWHVYNVLTCLPETNSFGHIKESKISLASPSRYIVPSLYENWTRMFRKNYLYRSAHSKRKQHEQRLLMLLDQYKFKLNTEMLALMQEMHWDQMEIITEHEFDLLADRTENVNLTMDEYMRWLHELQMKTEDFKTNLLDLQ